MTHATPKTQHHLFMWGGAFNEGSGFPEAMGIGGGDRDLWFDSKEELSEFDLQAKRVARSRGLIFASVAHHGPQAMTQTVASMTLVDGDGAEYSHSENFGYGYSHEAAEYMFCDGNYSCDCYLSDIISDSAGDDGRQRGCGSVIKVRDLSIKSIGA